jgi:LEA14-like dessication related protein
MNVRKILIWTGVISLATGIALWLKYQLELSYKLIYSIEQAKVKKLSPKDVIVEFDLAIDNPTDLSVIINGMDIDVLANGVKVSNIFSQVQVELEANKKIAIPLKLTINPQLLIQNTTALLSTGLNIDNVVLTMKGKLKIKKFGVPLSIPFIYKSTYKELMG